MAEPFIAEIRIFAGTFAPRGWAFCNGQLMQVSQNAALFSLVGTTYGGDGRTTFGLPNLQGRAPMHPGTGAGLSPRRLGQSGGSEAVSLTPSQIPSHSHALMASGAAPSAAEPANHFLPTGKQIYGSAPSGAMHTHSLPPAGGGQAHNNMQPFLALNFIIALVGIYPSRS